MTMRLAGVMSIVVSSGVVRPGDTVHTISPAGEYVPLEVV